MGSKEVPIIKRLDDCFWVEPVTQVTLRFQDHGVATVLESATCLYLRYPYKCTNPGNTHNGSCCYEGQQSL